MNIFLIQIPGIICLVTAAVFAGIGNTAWNDFLGIGAALSGFGIIFSIWILIAEE